MLAVTFADLWFRARQFLIAVVGVALVLGLALALSGLADGFHAEVAETVDAVGATSWVMAGAAHGRVTAFAAFPASDQQAVAHESGVRRASAVLFAPAQVVLASGSSRPLTVNLFGVQRNGFGDPHVTSGHALAGADQVVVNSSVAPVGGVLIIGGRRYDVVGTVHGRTMLGGVPLVYMTLPAVQQAVIGGRPLITALAVAGNPAAVPAGLVVLSPSTVVAATEGQLKTAVQSIDNTRWLMWVVAAAIVASMLYVAALERKRDFAVLKALGSSSRTLFLSLVLEAVVVTLLAAVLAEFLAGFLTRTFSQPVDITLDAAPRSAPRGRGGRRRRQRHRTAPRHRRRPGHGVRMSDLLVDDLTMAFDSGGYVIKPLDGLNFTAGDGELVVLLGPSGCGKTTLLSCLAGLLTPTSGRIEFGSIEVTELRGPALADYRRQTVGVVFQAFNLIASLTARGNVVVPMRLARVPRARAKQRADELLELVGLGERAHHRPAQLSGGQQQRVAIARALVHEPPLILADEPTAHLDHIQVEGILRLLRELAGPGRIVVVSTHDDRVSQLADRVVELAPHFTDMDRPPELVRLAAGDVLFRQNERGELIYQVESGLLEVYRELADGGREVVAQTGPGNYVGEFGSDPELAPQCVGASVGGHGAHGLHGAGLPPGPSPSNVRTSRHAVT